MSESSNFRLPLWSYLAIGATAGLVLCGGGGSLVAWMLWPVAKRVVQQTELAPSKKLLSREDFERIARSARTREELIGKLGRPNGTLENETIGDAWLYFNRVHNPVTDKPSEATIEFEPGHANPRIKKISW